MMQESEIISWFQKGDIAIQYQFQRDLFNKDKPDLQARIATEGWGKKYLSLQHKNGHWGRGFYQPKWISTHYTLLDLKNLQISPQNANICKSVTMLLDEEKGPDGGVNPSASIRNSDVCVNGMFLNYAAYFKMPENKLRSIIDFILLQLMQDGGFNCHFNRSGARHSSLHSTLSVLEGLFEYRKNGYAYRLEEITKAEESAQEFILVHKLFLSDRTGEIIKPAFLKLCYPPRWYYDILRALDYFQLTKSRYDKRIQPALDILNKKRMKNNLWPLQAHHPGQIHFEMEKAGKASRWNTLRALRVLKHFQSN